MKFQVTLKDPDTLIDAITAAVKSHLRKSIDLDLLNQNAADAAAEVYEAQIAELCGRWFKYGEYLTVEIDTDAKTCVVVPEKE